MSRLLRVILLLALLLALLPAPARAAPAHAAQSTDCESLLRAYQHDPALSAALVDPLLPTQAEIDALLAQAAELRACLASLPPGQRTEELQRLDSLAEYFLIFAAQPAAGSGEIFELIDLSTSDDPAVRLLRQQVGLPPPEGFVFFRSYPSLRAMPAALRAIFADPSIAGVTIFTRYVSVFDNQEQDTFSRLLLEQSLPDTISHELVHAYINATLGVEGLQAMPRWYDEGLATYLSGSEREHSVVTPSMTLTRSAPADYQQYNLMFDYLEHRLGRPALYDAIRRSALQADAGLLYRGLGIEDDAELRSLALEWQALRQRNALMATAGVLLLGMLAVLGGWGTLRQRLSAAAPDCQVCGRRFWPWRHGQLQRYEHRQRVWAECKTGRRFPHPRPTYVRRVCQGCLAHAGQLAAAAQLELAGVLADLRPRYAAWLEQAPLGEPPAALEGPFPMAETGDLLERLNAFTATTTPPPVFSPEPQPGVAGLAGMLERQSLGLPEAVDLLVTAALAASPRYRAWLERPSPVEFAGREAFDPLQALPPAHLQALQKTIQTGEQSYALRLGSIIRSPQGDVEIFWAPPAPSEVNRFGAG